MYKEAGRIWNSAKELFHYEKVEKTLKKEIPHAGIEKAFVVMAGASLLLGLIAIGALLETWHMVNYLTDLAAESAVASPPPVTMDEIVPFIMFMLLFNTPFFIIYAFIYEGVVYGIMRATGGRATFAQQFYLSSIATLSLVFVSALVLLTPLPCLNLLGAIALVVLSLYFTLYVNVKVYQTVHDVEFAHSFLVVVVLLVPKFWLMLVASNAAAAFFGLPPSIDLSGVENGI